LANSEVLSFVAAICHHPAAGRWPVRGNDNFISLGASFSRRETMAGAGHLAVLPYSPKPAIKMLWMPVSKC